MFKKLQPRQISLHSFSSPSGDFNFGQGDTGVTGNLSRFLTGDFSLYGALSINSGGVRYGNPSNITAGPRNTIVGGRDNDSFGTGNFIINSELSQISGSNNLDLNGNYSYFGEGSKRNTSLGGNLCTVPENISGSVLLGDATDTSLHESNQDNSLFVSFSSGTYFNTGKVRIEESLGLYGGFKMSSGSSGLFSGDINVLGRIYQNNTALMNMGEFQALSGKTSSLSGSLAYVNKMNTGLDSRITALEASGIVSGLLMLSGDQIASGKKTFVGKLIASGNPKIQITGEYTIPRTLYSPTSPNSSGEMGALAFNHALTGWGGTSALFLCTYGGVSGVAQWCRIKSNYAGMWD